MRHVSASIGRLAGTAEIVCGDGSHSPDECYRFRPENLDECLKRYAKLTREDIRLNRENLAAVLGFVVAWPRKRKNRWLADVLKQAGEKADYIESVD